MVSKLSKEGSFRKGLEVFQALLELGIPPDTAITNSAISACDKGTRPALRTRACVTEQLLGWVFPLPLSPCTERIGTRAAQLSCSLQCWREVMTHACTSSWVC